MIQNKLIKYPLACLCVALATLAAHGDDSGFGPPAPQDWGQQIRLGSSEDIMLETQELVPDGTGRLWGLAYATDADRRDLSPGPFSAGKSDSSVIVVFVDDDWHRVIVEDMLVTGVDGKIKFYTAPDKSVIVFSLNEWRAIQFYGDRAKSLAVGEIDQRDVNTLDLLADSHGETWTVINGDEQCFIFPDARPKHILSIDVRTPHGEMLASMMPYGHIPMPQFADAMGRSWLSLSQLTYEGLTSGLRPNLIVDPYYSPERDPKILTPELQGLLQVSVSDGASFRFVSDLPSGEVPTPMAVFDEQLESGAIGVEADGTVWDLDLTSLDGVRTNIVVPKEEAYPVCGTTYNSRRYIGTVSTLWEEQSRGVWKQLSSTLNRPVDYWFWGEAKTEHGFFLTRDEPGLWFIPPEGGKILPIGKEQGFPVDHCVALYPLPNGRLFLNARYRHELATPQALAKMAIKPKLFEKVETRAPLIQNRDYHVFGLMADHPNDLCSWPNGMLVPIPLPNEFPEPDWVAADTRGHIWVGGAFAEDCLIFDPESSTWSAPGKFAETLLNAAREGTKLTGHSTEAMLPAYGPDGRLAVYDKPNLHHFDGTQWQEWDSVGLTGRGGVVFDKPATFTNRDTLRVSTHREAWEFSETNEWTPANVSVDFGGAGKGVPARYRVPGAEPAKFSATDRLGVTWSCGGGRLTREYRNQKDFPIGDVRPPVDSITSVLLDEAGNAYVRGTKEVNTLVIVFERATLLDAIVTEGQSTPYEFVLNVRTMNDVPYVWRRNGGEWSGPSTKTELRVALESNASEIEIASFGPEIAIYPTPKRIDLPSAPSGAVEFWMGQIKTQSSAEELEHATGALIGLDDVLPALQNMRENCSGDACWWLDVAIQRVQSGRPAP